MKKIFIISILICSTIFNVGCGQSKQTSPENNSTTTESKQDDNSSTSQDNSNNQASNNDTTNSESASSQNGTENKKTDGTSTNKKDSYTKKLDSIQAKIDKDYVVPKTEDTEKMKKVSSAQFKLWDDELNEIYKDLQSTLSSDDKKKLEEDEKAWIAKKESDAQNASKEVKGGTLEPVYYTLSLVDSTKNRCYELVANYVK